MKALYLTFVIGAALASSSAYGALNIPSDGSDGDLIITSDTVIDLSQAVTGNWDTDNSANAGKGIYDPTKWAVVFKYSSVTINGGATVTFKNRASRAPVVWLVSGNVTIDGAVSLDGQKWQSAPTLAEPGPGGFRGSSGNYAPGAVETAGFGPGGGGIRLQSFGSAGGAGSYGSQGSGGQPVYGNPSLIPLVGGSGGGGRYNPSYANNRPSGGGGAGAMLIASKQNLSISGTVRANGGSGDVGGDANAYDGAGGSGGGIRLVCEALFGTGVVQCLGGTSAFPGGLGRISIERVTNNNTLQTTPDPNVVPLPDGATPQIWLPDNGPTVRIVSIGGSATPADPRAGFNAIGADIVLPKVSTTTVVVETTNVEEASVVTVRATPRSNGDFKTAPATVTEVVSEDPKVLRWTANVPVNAGYSAVQVKVVRPE